MTAAACDDRAMVEQWIHGFQVARLLRLVVDAGVADRLAPDESLDVADLARRCSVQAEPLLRVVRALAAFAVFALDGTCVRHTARSRWLRADVPDSLHLAARFWAAPGSWRAWGELDAALRGEVPHEVAWQCSRFDHLRDHPDEARLFDRFMAAFPDQRHEAVARAYDFSSAGLIVDVGGGNGETLRRVLARHPGPRGLVFDRAHVVGAIADEARAGGRLAVQAGDFFDEVPAGGDLYLLVRVLHDWPDESCVRLLRRCRAAMAAGARLLVVERLLEPDPTRGQRDDYLLDIQMMAMFGRACERTAEGFAGLAAVAGLRVVRQIDSGSPVSIIEMAPAD